MRRIILLSLGLVFINSEPQVASDKPAKPMLKKQQQKTNLTRAKLCPKLLTGDEIVEFAEADSSSANDPKNTLIKDNVRLRSALPANTDKRRLLQSEQDSKGGDWALNIEEPMGQGSSLCTYVNSRLDADISSVKISAYPKK